MMQRLEHNEHSDGSPAEAERRFLHRVKLPRFMPRRPGSDDGGSGRKPNIIQRKVMEWADRLLGAVKAEGSFGDQEAIYEGNNTKADYAWNSIGYTAWGVVFPLLTIVVTQLVGAEEAGRFSLAFVFGLLLMIVGNYGTRTYQVSDANEQHSFIDYQVNRFITCIIMMVVGWFFCDLRAYDDSMRLMFMCVLCYKMVDAMADVYEGRLHQQEKLYLAGISLTLRSGIVFVVFTVFLFVTRSLVVASIAMAVVAVASLILFTIPLATLETPKSKPFSFASLGRLFMACFPAFLALFLYAFIENMPKFVMEGMLSYDNQLYFNALYFPAQTILMTTGLLYRPLLTRMTETWNDISRRRRFDIFILAGVGVIALITLLALLIMHLIGIPILSFFYGVDFEQFRNVSYLMIIAGGITGGIDFLYQAVTVMRRQKDVMKLYAITFVFSLFVPYMLVRMNGLRGAVVSYLIVMAILFVLMVVEYVRVRMDYHRNPEGDPVVAEAKRVKEQNIRDAVARKRARNEAVANVGGIPEIDLSNPRGAAQAKARERRAVADAEELAATAERYKNQ